MKRLLFLIALMAFLTLDVLAQKGKNTKDSDKHYVAQETITPPSSAPPTILCKDVAKYMGEYVTVCDKVFTTRLIEESNTTLLNLGGSFPNQTLTVMIPGEDRSKFKDQPEVYYKGRNVCV